VNPLSRVMAGLFAVILIAVFVIAVFVIAVVVALLQAGGVDAGRALVLSTCAAHVLLGPVLPASDRRLWTGALVQAVPTLVVPVACGLWG